MPDLPTITVTQAQADRILTAFGGTPAIAVPAYKDWLRMAVRGKVLQEAINTQAVANVSATQAAVAATSASLPPAPSVPESAPPP